MAAAVLARLLIEPSWMPIFGARVPQPAVRCLNPLRIPIGAAPPPNGGSWLYLQSHHLREASRKTLRQFELDDDAYKAACDRFEYLASMVAIDPANESGPQQPWAGEFILRVANRFGEEQSLGVLITQELVPGWPFLAGGAFGGDLERAKAANDALLAWIAQYGRTT